MLEPLYSSLNPEDFPEDITRLDPSMLDHQPEILTLAPPDARPL